MYVRTVRGSTPRASAATRVDTHPDSPAPFPRVWPSPTQGILDHQDRGRKPLEAILTAPGGTEGALHTFPTDRDVGFSKVRLARY